MSTQEPPKRPAGLLPLLVGSLLSCTSLWFAGNAVLGELTEAWNLGPEALGWTTSAVQLGFLIGTLGSASLGLADRFAPRRIFFACAVIGAALTAGPVALPGFVPLLVMRFLTGVCLAGIYPIAMKLAASWYEDGLGLAMGFLVSALALGTSVPHLIRGVGQGLSWQGVLLVVAGIAVCGGTLVLLKIPQGPYGGSQAPSPGGGEPQRQSALRQIFGRREFRAAAFGYVGHMWELYAFWAFVPAMLTWHAQAQGYEVSVSLWAAGVIALGGLGCIGGGYLSQRIGSARTASVMLAVSGACSLGAPLFFEAPRWPFIFVMCLWGVSVIGDSAQFSTLYSKAAPAGLVGSAITVVTAIGFGITIVSIELVAWLSTVWPLPWVFPLIALGPAASLVLLRGLRAKEARILA